MSTNVAKYFLSLVNKHFQHNNENLKKIFNRNNVKVSYSCMPNMKTIINAHNKKVTSEDTQSAATRTCDCVRNTKVIACQKTIYTGTVTSNLPNYGEKICRSERATMEKEVRKPQSIVHLTSFCILYLTFILCIRLKIVGPST